MSEQVKLMAAEYTYRHAIESIYNQLHISEPDHLNMTKDSDYFRDEEQIQTKQEYMEKFN